MFSVYYFIKHIDTVYKFAFFDFEEKNSIRQTSVDQHSLHDVITEVCRKSRCYFHFTQHRARSAAYQRPCLRLYLMFVVQLSTFEYEALPVSFMASVLMNPLILLNYKGLEEIPPSMINSHLTANVQHLHMKGNRLTELVMSCLSTFSLGLHIFFKYLYFGSLFM